MIIIITWKVGAGQISVALAVRDRRLTFPRIAAGSKTFFWNVIK